MTIGQMKKQIEQAELSDECEVRLVTEEGIFGISSLMTEDDVLLIDSGDEIIED